MERIIKFRAWGRKIEAMSDDLSIGSGWLNKFFREMPGYPDKDEWKIMQFTGLFDMKGREIYEGDLLRYYPSIPSFKRFHLRQVVWNTDKGAWQFKKLPTSFAGEIVTSQLIRPKTQSKHLIVGNIYENPDLLKLTP